MWGVVLAKSGTGVIGVWSVVNIYFFSYFKLVRRKQMNQTFRRQICFCDLKRATMN